MAVTRRVFLAGLGSAGVGFGVGGLSHFFPLASPLIGPEWRPGKETFVPSTCLLCPSHCGILGRVMDGRLVSVAGNPLHPISRGGLCPKGVAGAQLLHHPARLTGPLERNGESGSDRFERIPWESALARVTDALRALRAEGRPHAVAWLSGDVRGSLGELVDRFLRVYGGTPRIREDYADGSDEVMALTQGRRNHAAFDLDHADLVLSFGAPLSEAWWCLPQAARARDLPPERRSRWIQVDTRLSRTAVSSDRLVPVRPGSYGALALAIGYVLLKEGSYDAEWVHGGVSGFEDGTAADGQPLPGYRSLVLRHGRPEAVAKRTGVRVEEIVRLAKDFGRAERPLAVWDHAVTWSRGGLADALAIHALNVLTGSLGRAGGVFVQPPLPVPSLEEGHPEPKPSLADSRAALHSHEWADRVLEGGTSPIDVLFLHHSNPVASHPDPEKVRRALTKIPLVVSFSPFLDESARHANLVLPDCTYLERWQDAPAPPTVPYAVWSVVQPVVPPMHDTRATGDVLLDLAARIGDPVASAFPWSSMEEIVRGRGEALSAAERGSTFAAGFRREELREMEARGWWIPHGQDGTEFWESLRKTGGWFDPFQDDRGSAVRSTRSDGRVALFPEEARRAISEALPGLAAGFLPVGVKDEGEEVGLGETEGRPLRLMPYRLMTLTSGTIPLMPWLLESLGPVDGGAWEPWVEIHPETGRRLGLPAGRKVRVRSEHGEFHARLRLFEGTQPGVVNAPYGLHSTVVGWGPTESANPLAAVGSARDPVTGLPDWYGTDVHIEPI